MWRRDLIVVDGWTTASETCSDGASSTDCRRLPVVNRIASDLLGFSCRQLCSNHWCTPVVHFSIVSMFTSRSSFEAAMYIWVSSAYWWCRTPKDPITDDREAMYKLKHRSQRWALRDAIVASSRADEVPDRPTNIDLTSKYDTNQMRAWCVTPNVCWRRLADHDFLIYAIECSRLVESNEDGWLVSIEFRIYIFSYFEKHRLSRIVSAIGRLHGVEAWWRQDVRDDTVEN